MYKCLECGHIFDEGEEKRWSEGRGECHGMPAYEEYCGCPVCECDFEETVSCKCCGGEFLRDELEDGYCEDCIEAKAVDFNFMFKAYDLAKETESVEINGLLAELFSKSEIEEILFREYKMALEQGYPNKHKEIALDCVEIITNAMDEEVK